MLISSKHTCICLILVMLFGATRLSATGAENEIEALAHPCVPWTDLIFKGSKPSVSITLNLGLRSPVDGCNDFLEKTGATLTDCSPKGQDVKVMILDRTAVGPFFSDRYTEYIWFNPSDGRTSQRIRWRQGHDPWIKNYCWTDKGVRRQTIRSVRRLDDIRSSVRWNKPEESFYLYPKDVGRCSPVADPTFVLLALSSRDFFRHQTPFEICVFGKKQLHRLKVRSETSLPTKVSFKIHSPSGEPKVETTLKSLIFSIATEPVASEKGGAELFSLLGLQEEIRIYIDASRCLPVRVSGKNAKIGKIVFDLMDASF